MPVTPTPGATQAPVASPVPSPAAIPPMEGQAAWYPAAEAAAAAWQVDAAFILATGNNMAPDGSALPIDGLSWQWNYHFVSLAAGKAYTLVLKDGKVIHSSEHSLWDNVTPSNSMINQYVGLYRMDECKVDSRQAIQTAGVQYKALTGRDPEGIVSYALLNNKDGKKGVRKMYWAMSFGKGGNGTEIKVDAFTGGIIL